MDEYEFDFRKILALVAEDIPDGVEFLFPGNFFPRCFIIDNYEEYGKPNNYSEIENWFNSQLDRRFRDTGISTCFRMYVSDNRSHVAVRIIADDFCSPKKDFVVFYNLKSYYPKEYETRLMFAP